MIGVLTLFGETDLQPVLKKVFEPKMILLRIILILGTNPRSSVTKSGNASMFNVFANSITTSTA